MSTLRKAGIKMLIQCSCGEMVGCIDETSNKMEVCAKCSDASFCVARFDFTGKVIDGICGQCAEDIYGSDFS